MNYHAPVKPRIIPKLWGREIIIENSEYCGKILELNQDCMCSIHYHLKKTETFYFLDGDCLFEWTRKLIKYRIPNGMSLKIEPGTLHRFNGIAPLTRILEVSTHDDEKDSIRIEESQKVEGGSKQWINFPNFVPGKFSLFY